MITFFTDHPEGIERWHQTWTGDLAGKIQIVTYEELRHRRRFHRGLCIFMSPYPIGASEAFLVKAAEHLEAQGCRILNRPGVVLGRYELLRALYEAGINDFNAYRLDELTGGERFPLFLRYAHKHTGPFTPPLHTPQELEQAIATVPHDEHRRHMIVVEYRNTVSPDGVYRKYGVFRLGDRFIPRHMLFSADWVAKGPKRISDEQVVEEAAFIETNPHVDRVRRVYDLAGMQYGRMDYSMDGDRMCVWEINPNPVLIQPAYKITPERAGLQVIAMERIVRAFAEADAEAVDAAGGPARFRLRLDHAAERLAGRGLSHRAARLVSVGLRRARLTPLLDRTGNALSRLIQYDR